ncbi:MAG: MAPEG family protein [Neisseriaceae bacterium]|nr:MAPEG family protein [Neisseriaceae bacterium]MBP6862270.1 MAPEG family protein [Neisseriaceae bacterium]
MTLAYWCVLVAMLLPLLTAMYAKASGGFKPQDNHDPRAFLSQLQGKAARAQAAQANAYEVNPFFAAAVIIAHVSGGAVQTTIDLWATLFVLSRLAFIVCYVRDWPTCRSASWGLGLVCIVALFIAAV